MKCNIKNNTKTEAFSSTVSLGVKYKLKLGIIEKHRSRF